MDNNRRAAFAALCRVCNDGAYSNIAVAEEVVSCRADSESFVRNLVYGVLENRILLEYKLDRLVKTGLKKVKPRAAVLLRMGAYQIEFMDSVPDYAAINETVAIAKKTCRGLEGFINGVLRAYVRSHRDIPLPEKDVSPVDYLSVKYSFAPDIAEMWVKMYGMERTESLMSASNAVPELSICVNTLKNSSADLAERLSANGFETDGPGISGEFREKLKERAMTVKGSGLMKSDEFAEGAFYVQDAASMAAVCELDPHPGDTVIDVCAAPGGKSFCAGIMMENRGRIISCDIYEHKLELIEKTAERLGISCIETMEADGRISAEGLIGAGDTVIVDAPCSGLGVLRRRPEIKYKKPQISELAALQLEILTNASEYVRPGGKLMYSTCTISNEENDAVADAFADSSPGFCILKRKQMMPDEDGCDGFYFCIFERKI